MHRFERALVACNRGLLIVLLVAMACIVFVNVVLRYTTGDSIYWAEEVARHLMVWVTFLGAGLVLRFGGHVAIDNLHRAAGPRWARWLRLLVLVCLGLFFLFMAYHAGRYVWVTRFQTTAATDIPFAWIYAALPLGFVLLFLHLLFIVRAYVLEGRHADSDELDAESAASV
jgi:TRAP-type C4-dicarboxylate transport system permease small subunit